MSILKDLQQRYTVANQYDEDRITKAFDRAVEGCERTADAGRSFCDLQLYWAFETRQWASQDAERLLKRLEAAGLTVEDKRDRDGMIFRVSGWANDK